MASLAAWDNFRVQVNDSSNNTPSSFLTLRTPRTLPHLHLLLFELGCLEVTNCFLGLKYFHP